jgi:succinoglycan biosynthesis transport protein ExoP
MATENGNKLIPADRGRSEPLVPVSRMPERGYGYGYGYGGVQEDQGGFHVREYVRIVLKNKWLILTLCVLTTTVVAVAAFKVQDEYVATATVLVGDENPALMAGAQPVFVYDWDGKRFKTRLRMLQMPDLQRRAVLQMDLQNNPNVFSDKPATLSDAMWGLFRTGRATQAPKTAENMLAAPIDPSAPIDEATLKRIGPYVGVVAGGLSVAEVRDTQLINISFRHHDPEIAAKVANTVAEVFISEDLNKRTGSKATASDFLRKRIAELQGQIRAGEERLLNYAKTHEILSLEDNSQNTVLKRLEALNDDLLKAEAERRDLEVQREALTKAGVTDDILKLPIAQQDAGAQEVSRQLLTAKQRLSELQQKYTDEYPAVKAAKEQIDALEADLEKVRQRLLKTYEAQYDAAVKKEQLLRREFEQQRGETMQQNEDAITYKIIQQEVDTNKKLLDAILQRSKEVDISAASESSPILFQNRAAVPGGAAGPDRTRWILTAFALSLFAGFGVAFGREYLDQTIRSIEDVGRVVRLPSLGVIPALSSGKKQSLSRRALTAGNGNGVRGTHELITTLEAKSPAAEAYRQLRTSVLLSSAGHTSKLLLVTSSQPREGKTTTAVNTAISLAQTGASTLIIDCDMRKPRVHQLLNVGNHVGVSLYLSGQNEDLSVLIQPHQIPNLSVLPCGPIPPNPAELLGSDQMRKLLDELVGHFDHVVIDTPPVVAFADPVILSTMVDGVILVVRGGFSSRGIVLRSRQILTDVGAKIYGVVLNDADMKTTDPYYYHGAYYGKYYNKDYDNKDEGDGTHAG